MITLAPLFLLLPSCQDVEHELYRARMAAAESAARLGEFAVAREWLEAVPPERRGFEWHVDDASLDESLESAEPVSGSPRTIAFDPAGRTLAVGTSDGGLELWSAADRERVWRVDGAHETGVVDVAFDPRGERLVTASHDRTVRLWNAADGASLGVYRGHAYPVGSALFTPDGGSVASCSYERPEGNVVGTVHVWSAADGTLESTLQGGRKPLIALALSPNGSRLAAASWDFCLFSWDLGAGEAPTSYPVPDEGVYRGVDGVAWSPDGELLAAASRDGTARVFASADGSLVASLRGHTGALAKLAFAPSGGLLATASADGTLRLWSVPAGEERAVLRGHRDDVVDVAWSPDGASLVSASSDGSLRSWDVDPSVYGGVRLRNERATYVVRFDPLGARLATCSYDGRVQVWSAATGERLAEWQAHEADLSCHALDWSAEGRFLATGSYDGTVRLWDSVTGERVGTLDHGDGVYWLRWSPDGERVAACGGGKVNVWDVARRERLTLFEGHAAGVLSVAFAPDSRRCVSTGRDGAALVWESDSGAVLARIEGLGPDVAEAVFVDDGARLVVAGRGGVVALYDASDGTRVRELARSREGIDHVALSPNGTRLALATSTVALVDAREGGFVGAFRPHRERPYHVDFDPRGERLASCSTDGTIAILDARPLRERLALAAAAREARVRVAEGLPDRTLFGATFATLADEVCQDEQAAPEQRAAWLELLTLEAQGSD